MAKDSAPLPRLPCLAGALRRAARLVSALYERESEWPKPLTLPQFSLLQAIAIAGPIPQSRLGWILGLDQTTASRSLAILVRRGFIRSFRGDDRRERQLGLTAAGRRELRRAQAAWRRAQARIRHRYGPNRFRRLNDALTELASLAVW